MAKIKVYRVAVYDISNDTKTLWRRMATREGARVMRGDVLEETEIEIDESRLEAGQQWTPRDFKA
jgi:hypothetical protein